jgi:hypothetical protein
MTRKLVIESSEGGRTEINYSSLDVREITGRIWTYEKRYGGNFEKFLQSYNCDNASPQEITDYMDWKNLVAELADRDLSTGRKKPVEKH